MVIKQLAAHYELRLRSECESVTTPAQPDSVAWPLPIIIMCNTNQYLGTAPTTRHTPDSGSGLYSLYLLLYTCTPYQCREPSLLYSCTESQTSKQTLQVDVLLCILFSDIVMILNVSDYSLLLLTLPLCESDTGHTGGCVHPMS